MGRLSRFVLAKDDIVKHFNKQGNKVYTFKNIETIFNENKSFWRLSISMAVTNFIEQLVQETKMNRIPLKLGNRSYVLYNWGKPDPFEVAINVLNDLYFSHYTALYYHNLTEQIPKTIYINQEQSLKKDISSNIENLSQENIHKAFVKPQRKSKSIGLFANYRICLLLGKNTGNLGVINIKTPEGKEYPITDIERTLIDITVRPAYAGGVHEVIKAYQTAKEVVSINKLVAILRQLKYKYPYHQCIGFYLHRAGYRKAQINLLKKFPINFDFYLTYEMVNPQYSAEWQLFYPNGM